MCPKVRWWLLIKAMPLNEKHHAYLTLKCFSVFRSRLNINGIICMFVTISRPPMLSWPSASPASMPYQRCVSPREPMYQKWPMLLAWTAGWGQSSSGPASVSIS